MPVSSALIPSYPDFVPLEIGLKNILHPRLSLTPDGVSEFTFSNLYLFRNKYKYRVSRDAKGSGSGGSFIISGEAAGRKTFFMTPCGAPQQETLEALFKTHDYWKNISESVLSPARERLKKQGVVFTEDRDNFDYLYLRKEMAELPGRKFHKKKNLINQFLSLYPDYRLEPLTAGLVPHAAEILEQWHSAKAGYADEEGDYEAAKDALDNFEKQSMKGAVVYINEKPAAYCLGESIKSGRMFTIQFEKAIETYKGIYQFINMAFAASLPDECTLINREQDLGKEGLRHAKTSYRPCGFVKKYTGIMNNVYKTPKSGGVP